MDEVTCSYRTLWNAYKRVVAGASDAERRRLMSGTALDTYRPVAARSRGW